MAASTCPTPVAAAVITSPAPPERIKREPIVNQHAKIGRNGPCPCKSGKKFKSCHRLALKVGASLFRDGVTPEQVEEKGAETLIAERVAAKHVQPVLTAFLGAAK